MFLDYPEQLLRGHLPYRGFESITGPGNPVVLATAYRVFGTSIAVERAADLAISASYLMSIFAIA